MDKKDLKLDKYGISTYRYRELRYFCFRYDEMKKRLNEIYDIYTFSFDDYINANQVSDTTSSKALKASKIHDNITMIENLAIKAGGDISKYLLTAVTKGYSYENLYLYYGGVPCGQRQFYDMRRQFFVFLDKERT